jgi:uncharacterized membrane protein HdeD (DUF308 family)
MHPGRRRQNKTGQTSKPNPNLVVAVGAVLVVAGSAIMTTLVSTSWNWALGVFALLLIIEGLDCVFFAASDRDRSIPVLFLWWPW